MNIDQTPVVFSPLDDPALARVITQSVAGQTIAEIFAAHVPGANAHREGFRILLVSDQGMWLVPHDHWEHVRPKAGVSVVIRTVPAGDGLRSILSIVVMIAASALAPGIGTILGGGFFASSAGISLITAGLGIAGNFLVNTLIPPAQSTQATQDATQSVYTIDGWRNELRPGAPVPFFAGKHRYAPPFATPSYTEIVGDDQYIRSLFLVGYGPLRLSDLRIGETPLDEFSDIEVETREGYADDAPVTLLSKQVIEQPEGVELIRPLPRDASGELVEDGESVVTPVTRFTASDSAQCSVVLAFSSGLFRVDDDGNLQSQGVTVIIHQRKDGIGNWELVENLRIQNQKREVFFRQHTWTLPSRGRWQIQITRVTPETTDQQISDRVTLSAIQSIRPEYPINMDKPLSLVSVRIRASYQLSGPLDAFNLIAEAQGLVREDGAWVSGYERNPATAYLLALMGPQNPFPALQDEIYMDQIADWFDWCTSKGLKFDFVLDTQTSLQEQLLAICVAGRATPRHDGVKWGVIIDRPQDIIIDHINPRNSAQFAVQRSYVKTPDAFRIQFLDETNDYADAERIVPWPGHVGSINLTESLEMPGKVDPDEIWIEARRRQYEVQYRPDTFTAMQSGVARVATRGDKVMGSFDVLDSIYFAARVKWVSGNIFELDDAVNVDAGSGVRLRVFANADDTIGTSIVRPLRANDEASTALTMVGDGPTPQVGDIVHIGPLATESLPMRILSVEAAEANDSRLTMIADAPELDAMTDAEVPPEWDGRVGDIVDAGDVAPSAPIFVEVTSGFKGTGAENLISIQLEPAAGSSSSVTSFELDHRIPPGTSFTTETITAASGGTTLSMYQQGDIVELVARSVSGTAVSPNSEVIQITVGAADPDVPAQLDDSGIVAHGGLGHVALAISLPQVTTATALQIYRTPAGTALDRTAHAKGQPISVSAGTTAAFVDGDNTRTDLINANAWTLGAGWTEIDGAFTHTASGGQLEQALDLIDGATYRLRLSALSIGAGYATPMLTGGVAVIADNVDTNGTLITSFVATSDSLGLSFDPTTSFDGTISAIQMYQETAGCIARDVYDYYVEPINSDGQAGPVSGPFSTEVL